MEFAQTKEVQSTAMYWKNVIEIELFPSVFVFTKIKNCFIFQQAFHFDFFLWLNERNKEKREIAHMPKTVKISQSIYVYVYYIYLFDSQFWFNHLFECIFVVNPKMETFHFPPLFHARISSFFLVVVTSSIVEHTYTHKCCYQIVQERNVKWERRKKKSSHQNNICCNKNVAKNLKIVVGKIITESKLNSYRRLYNSC
jgi:hypothetical protein